MIIQITTGSVVTRTATRGGVTLYCHNSEIGQWDRDLVGAVFYADRGMALADAFTWGGKVIDLDGDIVIAGPDEDNLWRVEAFNPPTPHRPEPEHVPPVTFYSMGHQYTV